MDIVNPDNLGMNAEDQDAVIKTITNVGNNLNDKGVFCPSTTRRKQDWKSGSSD